MALLLSPAAPDAGRNTVTQRPVQAASPHRAAAADLPGLVDVRIHAAIERGQISVIVQARGAHAPVHYSFFHMQNDSSVLSTHCRIGARVIAPVRNPGITTGVPYRWPTVRRSDPHVRQARGWACGACRVTMGFVRNDPSRAAGSSGSFRTVQLGSNVDGDSVALEEAVRAMMSGPSAGSGRKPG